jgi:hypothetical protein
LGLIEFFLLLSGLGFYEFFSLAGDLNKERAIFSFATGEFMLKIPG